MTHSLHPPCNFEFVSPDFRFWLPLAENEVKQCELLENCFEEIENANHMVYSK